MIFPFFKKKTKQEVYAGSTSCSRNSSNKRLFIYLQLVKRYGTSFSWIMTAHWQDHEIHELLSFHIEKYIFWQISATVRGTFMKILPDWDTLSDCIKNFAHLWPLTTSQTFLAFPSHKLCHWCPLHPPLLSSPTEDAKHDTF